MHDTEKGMMLTAAVGWAMQQLRAKRTFPDWAYYSMLVGLCAAGYVLVRGDELKACPSALECARIAAVGLIVFVQQARGSGAAFKDAGAAPPANTKP